MFNKLKSLFSSKKQEPVKKPEEIEKEDSSEPPKGQLIAETGIRWLTAEESPFEIAGVDCFKCTQTMRSVTQDENVAMKFFSLRNSNGDEYVGKEPESAISIPGKLCFEYSGEPIDFMMFKAKTMEEKWDIYIHGNKFYFCRSWTGELIYTAEVEYVGDYIEVTKLLASENLSSDKHYLSQQINYLIRHEMLGHIVPHPLPSYFRKEDLEEIALYSFKIYGKNCCFGTFEETIGYIKPQDRK